MGLTKEEIEYWNDRSDEILAFVPVHNDNYSPPTEKEQAETDAEIERIMKEYYSQTTLPSGSGGFLMP